MFNKWDFCFFFAASKGGLVFGDFFWERRSGE